MKKAFAALCLLVALAVPGQVRAGHGYGGAVYPYPAPMRHVQVRLYPVGSSGVNGIVDLQALPRGGTRIIVLAFGLPPGSAHVSLYYGNAVCALEPYSVNDVIGGIYFANAGTVGTTAGVVEDNLSQIHSVSVREAGTFALQACARIGY